MKDTWEDDSYYRALPRPRRLLRRRGRLRLLRRQPGRHARRTVAS